MIKTVDISLGSGSLEQGFPLVTVQLLEGDRLIWESRRGSLPPATDLAKLHGEWNDSYDSSLNRQPTLSSLDDNDDDDDFIDKPGITRWSEADFKDICARIIKCINDWLGSKYFNDLVQQVRNRLNINDEIRVIIRTDDDNLWKLPWDKWNLFDDFDKAAPVYSKLIAEKKALNFRKKKVRTLAILGNDKGVDLEQSLSPLKELSNAEIVILKQPTRQEFNEKLWDKAGWSILFFTGHSDSKTGKGKMYINNNEKNNFLTIEELKEALKTAINQGLKIAIFNSCDGVGLATDLAELKISQIVVMKREVPNYVALEFFKYLISAFASERLRFDLAVNKAKKQLQGLEDSFPGASWLPLIYHNSAEKPPNWKDFLENVPDWTKTKCRSILTPSYNPRTPIPLFDNVAKNIFSWVGKNTVQYGIKIAFSADKEHFASCGYEAIELWNLERKQRVSRLMEPKIESFLAELTRVETWFTSVAISPDGQTIAACKYDKVCIWNRDGRLLYTFPKSYNFFDIFGFDAVAFSPEPDRQILAFTDDRIVKLWSLTTGIMLDIFNRHSDKVTDLAFSPDGKVLASCSDDSTIRLWDMDRMGQKNFLTGHSQGIVSIAFSPDGKTLASGSHDKTVKLWCTDTGREKNTFSKHSDGVLAVAFSPDGQTLASGGDDKNIILCSVDGSLKCTLLEHERAVTSLAFSPDGRSLVSGSRDQTIRIWEPS